MNESAIVSKLYTIPNISIRLLVNLEKRDLDELDRPYFNFDYAVVNFEQRSSRFPIVGAGFALLGNQPFGELPFIWLFKPVI